jgi:hypothetical protein
MPIESKLKLAGVGFVHKTGISCYQSAPATEPMPKGSPLSRWPINGGRDAVLIRAHSLPVDWHEMVAGSGPPADRQRSDQTRMPSSRSTSGVADGQRRAAVRKSA